MEVSFFLTAAVAILATGLTITRLSAVHALLYLVVSLLAVSLLFFLLGAPFAAALEVIVYAGAIIVLFIFVVMMLNLGPASAEQERRWLSPGIWWGPSLLTALLLGELIYVLWGARELGSAQQLVGAKQVGIALFGPYLLAVELASILLMGALVGAYHLGRREGTPGEGQ